MQNLKSTKYEACEWLNKVPYLLLLNWIYKGGVLITIEFS